MMRAARQALLDVADRLRVSRRVRGGAPRPLDLAVLAVRVAQAMELVAAEQVERARAVDGVTRSFACP